MSCRVGLAVRSCVLAALLAVVGALGLVPMVAAPAVATGGGFAGPEALAFVSQGASRTQLTTVRSPASGGIAMDTVGPPGKLVYDALAYDQNDGYLYAITNDGGWFGYAKGQILKIARGGAISGTGWNIGAITGERTAEVTDPETGQRTGGQTHTFVAGTWGDGDYFVRAQGSTTIHRVSLAADVEAAQIEPTLDGAALEIGGDLVYVDGSLWSVLDDGRLARVSTADGAASAAAVAGLPAGSYGAQWLFPDGAFGASGQTLGVRADSGEVYQVTLKMTGPVATPRGPDTPRGHRVERWRLQAGHDSRFRTGSRRHQDGLPARGEHPGARRHRDLHAGLR